MEDVPPSQVVLMSAYLSLRREAERGSSAGGASSRIATARQLEARNQNRAAAQWAALSAN